MRVKGPLGQKENQHIHMVAMPYGHGKNKSLKWTCLCRCLMLCPTKICHVFVVSPSNLVVFFWKNGICFSFLCVCVCSLCVCGAHLQQLGGLTRSLQNVPQSSINFFSLLLLCLLLSSSHYHHSLVHVQNRATSSN